MKTNSESYSCTYIIIASVEIESQVITTTSSHLWTVAWQDAKLECCLICQAKHLDCMPHEIENIYQAGAYQIEVHDRKIS